MKKSTLSFVIAAVIASNVNVSNAATITGVFKGTQDTNPGVMGDFFISGEEGINYDFDKANTGLTNAQKDIIQAQKDIAANAGNVAGKADQTALTAEVNRATGAEAGLDSRVTSVNSFAGAINATVQQQAIDNIQRDKTIAGNTQAVATEAATRTAQVQKLDSDITGETTRAKAAEGANTAAITTETHRATGAEAGLDSRVTSVEGFAGAINATVHQQAIADVQRDKTIAGNTQAVADEAATRTAQVQKLDSDITGETTRAKAAEGANTAAITTETQRATGAEAGLDSRVTSVEGFAGAINATVQQQAIDNIQRDKTIAGNTQAVADEAATRTAQVQKLDKDITGETTRAKAAEGANTAAITTETQRATGAEQANASGIQTNAAAISTEATRAAAVEQANAGALLKEQARATYAENNNEQHINANANRISADEQTEAGHFKTLQTAVDQKVDTGTFQQRAADVDQRIAERKAAQQKTDAVVSRHSAELANHETRIESLEANTSANFGKLKSQVEENRKRASAGVSGAMAQANIPQVIQGQTFAVGAAVGGYDDQNALAVGFSARAAENVVVKVAASEDTAHKFGYGAGVSVGW